MRKYRDVTCDPITGVRLIDLTAAAILDILTTNSGSTVLVRDVDAAIIANSGKVSWKMAAVKALQNQGWVIDIDSRRHLTTYRLAGTPAEIEDYRTRRMAAIYSQSVTIGRFLNAQLRMRPLDPTAIDTSRRAELLAIAIGADPAVGKNAARVLADLVPL